MEIQKNTIVPLYVQVKEQITNNIKKNYWHKGSKIPSENSLMKNLGVSRGTIKKAIGELVSEGILVQKQGLGTFVQNKDFSVPLTEGLHSFYEHMKANNIDFETIVLSKKIVRAEEETAKLLKVEVGTKLLFLERIRKIEGEVVMFIQNFINLNLAPNIENEDFTHDSLFNIIESHSQKKVSYSETRFAAVSSDKQKSKDFEIKLNSPLLFQEQLVHLDDDNIIELGRVWLKSNRFYIGLTMRRTY